MMSRLRAPIALRRPISRVRSVTETSMMFMMPIPPTRSEIPAMPPKKMVNTPVIVPAMSRKFCWVKIVKSSTPIGDWWRARRMPDTSSWAAATWLALAAWMRIMSTELYTARRATNLDWAVVNGTMI